MNPCLHLRRWILDAVAHGIPKSNAMVLSTVGEEGYPSSRMLLAHQIDHLGVRFYTDIRSRKILELSKNGHACGLFYWPTLGRQVRLEGTVSELEGYWADKEFQEKSYEQQLVISLFVQSSGDKTHPVQKRLFAEALERSATRDPLPRPEFWRGFLLSAQRIEFFKAGEGRLNKRVRFDKLIKGWRVQHLQP